MKLLTVRDVADRLRLSISKIYAACSSGNLPHYRIDGTIRISEEQLLDYLESVRIEGPILPTPPELRHLQPPAAP